MSCLSRRAAHLMCLLDDRGASRLTRGETRCTSRTLKAQRGENPMALLFPIALDVPALRRMWVASAAMRTFSKLYATPSTKNTIRL